MKFPLRFWSRAGFLPLLLCCVLVLLPDQACHGVQSVEQVALPGAKTPPVVPNAGSLGTIFAVIADKTIPTVVSVIPTQIDTVIPLKDLPFGIFGGESRRTPSIKRVEVLGAGVIVSPDGLILSNNHVVSGASSIEVLLSDGRRYGATIVGTDSLSDVAVLRITTKVSGLPVASFGNSDSLRQGDWVLALGNPFALTSSITLGIVSALNRQIESPSMYENFIQTDAAINPGNSGGALVNIRGELVGINSTIFTETGGFMGIGFAIPINMARHYAGEIVKNGRVVRGFIGIAAQDVTQDVREALGLPAPAGALISQVVAAKPAEQAGIRAGDVVVSIDKKEVGDANDLRNLVAEIAPGTTVTAALYRNGKPMNISLRVGERSPSHVPASKTAAAPKPEEASLLAGYGIEVAVQNADPGTMRRISRQLSGIVVTSVNAAIQDQRFSLNPGDVITQVKAGGSPFLAVNSVEQFKSIAAHTGRNIPVMLFVTRSGSTFYVAFRTP